MVVVRARHGAGLDQRTDQHRAGVASARREVSWVVERVDRDTSGGRCRFAPTGTARSTNRRDGSLGTQGYVADEARRQGNRLTTVVQELEATEPRLGVVVRRGGGARVTRESDRSRVAHRADEGIGGDPRTRNKSPGVVGVDLGVEHHARTWRHERRLRRGSGRAAEVRALTGQARRSIDEARSTRAGLELLTGGVGDFRVIRTGRLDRDVFAVDVLARCVS